MGQCFATLGRPEPALQAFARALALAEGDGEARFGRARALTALQRDALAIEAWDAVLGAGGQRAVNLHGQRVRVLTDDFRLAQARLSRARCLERLGSAGAQAAFAAAFEAEGPKLPIAREAFLQALRDSPAARAAYRDSLAKRAREAGPWFRAVDAYRAAGLFDEARAACEVLVRLEPDNAQAWFARAEAHAVRDEVDEAEAAYRRALELWPEFLAARARLDALRARR